MWSLHTVTEDVKKFAVFGVIGLIILILLWSIVTNLITYLNRPKYVPPSMGFGQLPPIPFPANTVQQALTYTLETVDGKADLINPNTAQPLPVSDRINVYRIIQFSPDLNSLQNSETKVASVGFINDDGTPLTEQRVSQTEYTWNKTSGMSESITMDITTNNFRLTSAYMTYPAVLAGNYMPTDQEAVATAQDFLNSMQIQPTDIDTSLTTTTDYTIDNNTLIPVTSADQKILAVGVNFFQQAVNGLQIMYPYPPNSTMSFLVTGGDTAAQISQATFEHQPLDISAQGVADYPLKTPEQAYADLQAGKGYITPQFSSGTNQVNIKTIGIGYYMGETPQLYMMPVYIFQGDNNFLAYVSAVADTAILTAAPSPAQ